jgi:putative endonuclease
MALSAVSRPSVGKSGHDGSGVYPIVMPGLVPGIHDWQHLHMAGGWVYITANRPQGTLYVGVTADLARRIQQHRDGVVDSFTKRYGLKRLVYAESHLDIRQAIQREKTIKHWPRAWKVRIIQADNPDWDDLYDRLMA